MISKILPEIRICLFFVSVLCFIKCNGQLSFYKNNSCGCFLDYYCGDSCESCTISNPKCSTKKFKFQAFEPENIENCDQWYLEGYNIKVSNIIDGAITVILLFSPKHLSAKYKIDLKIFDNSTRSKDNSTQTVIIHNHTSKYINIKNGTTCNSTLPVEFKFLFNGTYQLEIFRNEEGISKSKKCKSKPFNITSKYQERKLHELEPYYNSRYRPQDHSLVSTFIGGGLNLSENLHIQLCRIYHGFEYGCNCSTNESHDSKKVVVLDLVTLKVAYFAIGFKAYFCGNHAFRSSIHTFVHKIASIMYATTSNMKIVTEICEGIYKQELVLNSYFGNFSAGHHPYATVVKLKSHIDVSLRDCAGSGNEVAKYILHGKNGACCDCYDENASNGECDKQDACPCKWHENEEELTCNFHNISNGDYCIVVQFYDPRCASDTIWTKNGSCAWSYNETARGVRSDDIIRLETKFSNWIIFVPLIFIGAIMIISFVLYKYKPKCFQKLTHGLNNYAPTNLITQSSETPAISWMIRDEYEKFIFPEVLLLYPRDCESFMKGMAVFRSYLKSSNFKVYDPWDEEIYDDVVESCETWTLSFIKNKNVKIIIVLTECSKMFEEAFLDNSHLEYSEPQTLDTVFTQAISATHQYFAKRFDSYQRLFVIRIDGSPTTNFDFITPATVYSIPKNISLLISDLTSGNLKDIKSSKTIKMMSAFDEYESFINANSDYLSELLCPKKLNAT